MADETLISQFGLNALSITAFNGLIEAGSGFLAERGLGKLRENLKKYKPDGNHEIQEAILRSYLQATLQVCVVYGEAVGISANQSVIKELLPRFLAKAEILSHKINRSEHLLPENAEELFRRQYRELPQATKEKAERIGNRIYNKLVGEAPLSLGLNEAPIAGEIDEKVWLKKIIEEYTELLIQLSQKKLEFPETFENTALNELLADKSLLMQAQSAKEREDIVRESLLGQVEQEIIGKFGELPAGFRQFFFDNWFNYFCGCFHYQLARNPELARKFQSKLLADIEAETDKILQTFEKFSGEFGERLTGIEANLAWLAKEQREDFDGIRRLLLSAIPLIATLGDADVRNKLVEELTPEFQRVIDEITAIIQAESEKNRQYFDEKFEELRRREANLTPAEVEAEKAALVEEYLQSQSDKYSPSEFVGDIFNKDKFFVDRIDEQRNLLEWLVEGSQILILKGISGNGKTALMTEILQQVAPDANLRHEKIKGVLTFYFRDESRAVNFLDICKKADARLEEAGKPHSFAGQYKAFKKDYPNELPIQLAVNLIGELSNLGEILLVFDNFESALSEGRMTDEEIGVFVRLVLSRPNNLRLLLTSQVVPQIDGVKIPKPYDIGDLPRNYAEDFLHLKGVELRDEGVDCGLAEAADADLNKLFALIQPSPMTLVSFVGYLKILCETEGKVFADVLADGLRDFPAYDADDKNKGARYFIRQQYRRLSQIEQLVLKALSIFGRAIEFPVLKSILPLSLDARTILDYLKGNSLVSKVGRHRYELLALPKEVIANLPEDGVLETRRILHLKAAAFYLSIRKPVEECYTLEDFASYLNLIDHLFEAGKYDEIVRVFYLIQPKMRLLGFFKEIIERCQKLKGKISEPKLEADNFTHIGLSLDDLGGLKEAIAEYDEAINIYESLIEDGQVEFADYLALVYMNKGVVLARLGKLNEAINEYDKAINIHKSSVKDGLIQVANGLANAYGSKGNALHKLGRLNEAVAEYDKAIEIREPLFESGHIELAGDSGGDYMNKGVVLGRLGKLTEAIIEYDKAIEIYQPLVEGGRVELANALAMAYVNKGNVLAQLGRLNQAVDIYGEAIKLWENAVALHLLPNLVKAFRIRVKVLIKLKDWEKTAIDVGKAFMHGFPVLQSDEVSDHFKQLIGGEIVEILRLLSEVSAERREEIYRQAGEFGEVLKQNVEDFEKNRKKS